MPEAAAHTVECPQCHQRFALPRAVSQARMRCSRCGATFVGSSREGPQAAPAGAVRPLAPSAVSPPAPAGLPPLESNVLYSSGTPMPVRTRRSPTGIILLVLSFFGIAGFVGMVYLIYWLQTHPTIVVRDSQTGVILEKKVGHISEARRLQEEEKARKDEALRRMTAAAEPGQPAESLLQPVPPVAEATTQIAGVAGQTPTTGAVPAPAEQVKQDPLLDVYKKMLAAGTVGDVSYVIGRVLSKYPKPLQDVTVTAYVQGFPGPSAKYAYVSPNGEVRYSLRLGIQALTEEDVRVVAVAGKSEENLLVWPIEAIDLRRKAEAEGVVWTGYARNPFPVPLRNVKVHFDFFTSDGVWVGKAVADVPRTIAARKAEPFSVTFSESIAADDAVARATGEKY